MRRRSRIGGVIARDGYTSAPADCVLLRRKADQIPAYLARRTGVYAEPQRESDVVPLAQRIPPSKNLRAFVVQALTAHRGRSAGELVFPEPGRWTTAGLAAIAHACKLLGRVTAVESGGYLAEGRDSSGRDQSQLCAAQREAVAPVAKLGAEMDAA
jgi:hypothetical protein